MIQRWKILRELARVGQQLRAIPEAIWEPFAQRRHDLAFARGFALSEGQVPLTAKVALVLVWQPRGLERSIIDLCHHLVAQGYAPFIVSNAPLLPVDLARLMPLVWRVMERPNFGYDFGGYRDGVWQLQLWGVVPGRLVILNDSVWFPLWPDCTLLQRMEDSPGDLTGTVLRERGTEMFLESYALSLPSTTWQHPAFVAFWRDLRLTSNKYKVIRRGERGFGRALQAAGLSLTGVYGTGEFLERIAGADDVMLRATLRHAAFVDPAMARAAGDWATATGPDWREDAMAFVRGSLGSALFYCTYPVAAVLLMTYPVLKKSMEPVSLRWRRAFFAAVDAGVVPQILPAVEHEARARL